MSQTVEITNDIIDDALMIPEEKLEAIVLSGSFRDFAREAWHVIEPSEELEWDAYLDGLCLHLQALAESRERMEGRVVHPPIVDSDKVFRNLLINVPPRTLKSSFCSVLWPVWLWTRDPGVRILSSSYGADLAERDSVRSRRLIQSEWFQRLWGDTVQLQKDQNRKDRYDNTAGGYRIAVGKGSGTTGEGGDCLIADDPEAAGDMYSASARAHTKGWFGNIWSNRMNNPSQSCMLVIQQRIHEDDLTGTLLEQGDWVHLVLPMQYEGESKPTAIGWRDPRSVEGEYLTPNRFNDAEKAAVIRRSGEIGFATQYQQRAVPRTGAILKEDRWERYRYDELPARFRRVAAFADTASKKKQRNDYTAIALWGEGENGWWLLDLVWGKYEFPELVEAASEAWARWRELPFGWRPTKFVVEDASSGTALIQSFRKSTRIPVEEYAAIGDKEERVNAIAGYQYSGLLKLPLKDTDGLGEFDVKSFIAEHTMFPNAAHDDRVDTTTMMLLYWEIDPPKKKKREGAIVATRTARGKW